MTETNATKAPSYRWLVETLLFLLLIAQAVAWMSPAPLLGPIINHLGIGLGAGGLLISIVPACIVIFSLVGGVVSERLGAVATGIVAAWAMATGLVLSGYTDSYGSLLLCRILEGLGYGLLLAPIATLVMGWFPPREWAYVNIANSVAPFAGLALVFAVMPVIYHATGKQWAASMLYAGLAVAAIAILWTIFGREPHRSGAQSEAGGHGGAAGGSSMREVIGMRGVRLVAVALFGSLWTFQIFTAFLPLYLHTTQGMSLEEADGIVAILPLTAAFAAAGGGFCAAVTGLRRPFMWPIQFLMFVGAVGAVGFHDPMAIRLSMVAFGAGTSGPLSGILTTMMELPGMTPVKMGSAYGVIWAMGFAGAFISPFLGGAIAGRIGLLPVMMVFAGFALVATLALYLLPETGPGHRPVEVAAVSRA
ncbi:MAG TPA: MFS transporter [Candidatus Binataceae bacterium]|nr:MFS transporter [Candidatus Binataceae bacterium]